MNSSLPAADEPLLVISGLPSPEPVPAWVQAWSSAGIAQWLPPQSLLGPRSTAMASTQAHIVWLYRAPWSSVGSGGLRLGSWLSLQRQALRQRGQNAGVWTLVNAEEVDPDALAESLGLWVDTPSGIRGKEHETAAEVAGRKLLWAKLFDWAAPQAWEVYEALEAAAWSGPQQAAPLLRDELPAPDLATLEALQHRLSDAEEQTKLAQHWQERAQELQAAQDAALEESALLAQKAEAATAALQEELEQAFLQRKEIEAAAAQAAEAAQAAHAELTSQLENARAERDQRTAERDQASASLQQGQATIQQLQDAAQQSQAAQTATAEQLAQAQALAAQRESQLKEAQEEGELLLLQLHQVQEELEQLFLQGKEREAAATRAAEEAQAAQAELSRQLEGARAERDQRTAERDQKAAELHQRTAERDQANSSLQQAQLAVQQLQASLQQSQAAMEQTRQELHARTSERDQRTAERDQRTAERDQRTVERDQKAAELHQRTTERDQANSSLQQTQSAVQQLQASLQQSQAALEQSKAALEQSKAAQAETSRQLAEAQNAAAQRENQLKESQEEGELLLLQLHQVQEELETHFLKGKDLEQQLQSVRARYQRLQSRYPHAVDVDAVEVEKTDPSAEVPFVAWRLKGLSVGGTVWPELVLHTSLETAGAGVRLEAPAGSSAARGMDGPLVPKALLVRDAAQMERFRGIGQQAWEVLIAACAAVDEVLGAPVTPVPGAPADFDPTFWRQSLGALASVLRGLPPVFRHDGVRLKREKVNPDYEHLWLVFDAPSYGSRRWQHFEMRLGAAQTMPGLFSHLPKFEFPNGMDAQPPFDGWYEESRDDYGAKFELRVDLNRRVFDVGAWSRLPQSSQGLILSLIAILPAALTDLQRSGTNLSRPWSEWQRLMVGAVEVLRERLSPQRTRTAEAHRQVPTQPPEPTMPAAAPASTTESTSLVKASSAAITSGKTRASAPKVTKPAKVQASNREAAASPVRRPLSKGKT